MKNRTNFSQIVFFLNRACPVGCETCNASASGSSGDALTIDRIRLVLDRLEGRPEISRYIVWTGGEPFDSIEVLSSGIRAAEQRGYRSEILSSGYWFDSDPGRLDLISKCRNLTIRLSLDADHQGAIPLELIRRLASEIQSRGIRLGYTLRDIPGRQPGIGFFRHFIHDHLEMGSPGDRARSRFVHVVPTVLPGGHPSSPGGSGLNPEKCRLWMKDLVIGEDGGWYPCCHTAGWEHGIRSDFRIPMDPHEECLIRTYRQHTAARGLCRRCLSGINPGFSEQNPS